MNEGMNEPISSEVSVVVKPFEKKKNLSVLSLGEGGTIPASLLHVTSNDLAQRFHGEEKRREGSPHCHGN